MTRAPIPPTRRRLDVILPLELYTRIAAEAERNDQPVTREIITLLREALAARAKPAKRAR